MQVVTGYQYVVTANEETIITDSNGLNLTCPAGQLTYFVATADEVQVVGDATVTQTRGGIIAGGGGGGGGGDLPKGQLVGVDRQGEIEEIGKYVVYGGRMFYYNNDITRWDYDLPNLLLGTGRGFNTYTDYGMFLGCSNLTSFSGDMPKMTNGYLMFYQCSNLTSFSGDLSALTNGENMFHGCSSLTSFSGDLPALTKGNNMFARCTSLTSFSVDFPALTSGYGMFLNSTSLTSFSGDLSAMTTGLMMFNDCTSLTSFSGDLSAMTGGSLMFRYCSKMTSFNSDLSALKWGDAMFHSCKLDLASVQRIVNSVPSYTSGSYSITIGVDSTQVTQEQQDAANTILVGKGWTVTWQRN